MVLLVAVVVALLTGGLYVVLATPRYTAQAAVRFQAANESLSLVGTPASADVQPDKTAAQNARRIVQLDVAAGVRHTLRLGESAQALLDSVTAQVEPASNLITVSVEAGDATAAARRANAFVMQAQGLFAREERSRLSRAAQRLRRQLPRVHGSIQRAAYADSISRLISLSTLAQPLEVVEPATVPTQASSPRPLRDLVFALILGLLVGLGAVLAREFFDRHLFDVGDVEAEYQLPVVGSVGEDALGQTDVSTERHGFTQGDWEAFRIIRSNLRFLDVDREVTSVAVTSAQPEEGKSTVALWLAHASAVAGKRTLLVECDLRRPVLAARTGLTAAPGLTDYLAGDKSPSDVLQDLRLGSEDGDIADAGEASATLIPAAGFRCITAGSPSLRPAELLASNRFEEFAVQVSEAFDLIIFDTAPVLAVGDTLELLSRVDGVLVCARTGRLTREHIGAARAALERFPDTSAGLVLTGLARDEGVGYYGYYDTYRSRRTAEG